MSLASHSSYVPPHSSGGIHEEEEDSALEELDKKMNSSAYITNRVMVTNEGNLDPTQLIRTEGYMFKKGGAVNARGGFRNWKKRWFILAPVEFLGNQAYELQYYDGPKGNLKGKIGLSDVELYCEKKVHKNATNKRFLKFEFQLLLQNGGVLELSCDTEEERDEWLESLGVVITYLRRKVTTSNVMTLNGYDPLCEDDEESFRIGQDIAQNCQAYGPGLFGVEAGKLTQFLVQVHDLSGQRVAIGGMPISATIENETCLYYLTVQDHEDGTYSVSYTLGRSGKYKLSITLNEEHHIFGSPYDIEVLPSKTVPAMCYAEGEALAKIPTKQVSSFTIIAADRYGNRKQRGGDPFEIGIMGPAQLLQLKDNDDGSYTCAIEVLSPPTPGSIAAGRGAAIQFGTIMIMITLYGKAIRGSPFKPSVFEPQPAPGPATPSTAASMSKAKTKNAVKGEEEERRDRPQPQSSSLSAAPGSSSSSARLLQTANTANNANAATVSSSGTAANAKSKTPLQTPSKPSNALPPRQEDAALQSPLSRLERSRQRALLAKSLSEANPALNNSFTAAPVEALNSPVFGVSLQSLASDLAKKKQKAASGDSLSPPPASVLSSSSPSLSAVAAAGGGMLSGSKLSQIAQKNAATLQALRQAQTSALSAEEQTAPRNTAAPPADKPRNSFLTELSSNLKQGLGRMEASLSAASTPQEIELWDKTHRALLDDQVSEKLLTHIDTIFQLFSLFADRVEGVSVVKLITSKGHGGIYRLLELYEIIPNFLSKAETKLLFNRVLLAQRALKLPASIAGGGIALEFSCFVRLLLMVAIFTLSKTDLLASHYSSVEAKLDVLLYKWGIADPHRLAMVRQMLTAQASNEL